MTTEAGSLVWKFQDYLDGLCLRADVGSLRNSEPVVDAPVVAQVVDGVVVEPNTPGGIAEVAVRALVRAANQTRDLPSAVKAATTLLRYFALPVDPSQALPDDLPPDEPWLDQGARLAYQGAQALGAPQPLPEPEKAPVASQETPQRPSLRVVEAAEPRFWSSPTRPD